MRTDSLRISAEAADSAKNFISATTESDYYPEKARVFKTQEKRAGRSRGNNDPAVRS
jgi:DNA topoisomerase IA